MLRPSPIRARKSLGSNRAIPRSGKTALFSLLAFAFKDETDTTPGLSMVNFRIAAPAFGGNQSGEQHRKWRALVLIASTQHFRRIGPAHQGGTTRTAGR